MKDFFPSIGYKEIYKIFRYIGYTDGVSKLLTKLCTNVNDVLPQGSPASPPLSNLVSLKLDKRLSRLAESIGADYTRYADDMLFSSNIFQFDLKKWFIRKIKFILSDNLKVTMNFPNEVLSITTLSVMLRGQENRI